MSKERFLERSGQLFKTIKNINNAEMSLHDLLKGIDKPAEDLDLFERIILRHLIVSSQKPCFFDNLNKVQSIIAKKYQQK